MDDVSLTEEILLEPSRMALLLERAVPSSPNHQQARAVPSSSNHGIHHQEGTETREPVLQTSALPLSMSERGLSLPRPEPRTPGLSLQAR